MAYWDGTFSATNYGHILRLTASESSYDIPSNTSVVSWTLHAIKNTTYGGYSTYANPWSVSINGVGYSGTFTHNFSGQPVGYAILLASGNTTVTHNTDGSATIGVGSSATSSVWGSASNGGSLGLTTIPRASTPTFEQPSGTPVTAVNAGTSVKIVTNRASSGFTHTITYSLGTASGSIGTGVGADTTWTVPTSLMTQIPNSTSGAISIVTDTYNGGTLIGSKTVTLTMNVPSTVIPDIGSVTHSEATLSPNVATIVGAYVKTLSKLSATMTGVVGASGSTVASTKLELLGTDGVTVLWSATASGTTPVSATSAVLSQSGTLTLRGTVTDSRGRSYSENASITVLNYTQPNISSFTAGRSTAGGTLDSNGTYIRVDVASAVQSLIVGTQKNNLKYRLRIRVRGSATAWSSVTPAASSTGVGAVGFVDDIVVGTYTTANGWEIRFELEDNLGSVAVYETLVGTGGVLLFLDKDVDMIGVGKYPEVYDGLKPTSVDAKDYIYHRQGKRVLDVDDYATLTTDITAATKDYVGTIDPYWTYGKPNVTLAGSGTVVSAFLPPNDDDIQPGSTVVLTQTGGSWYIEGAYAAAPKFLRQVPLTLNTAGGWTQYDMIGTATFTGVDDAARFGPATVTKSATGWVLVTGLVYKATATSSTPILVATLPPGFRPAYEVAFPVLNASEPTTYNVLVKPNGEIWTTSTGLNSGHISLNNIQFNHTAATTNLTMANSWVAFGGSAGTPRIADDGQGLAFFSGAMKSGTITANTAFSAAVAAGFRPPSVDHIMSAASTGVFGGRRINTTGIPAITSPTPANTRYELEPMMWPITANNPGYNGMAYGNSWASYGSGYADLVFTKRPDGLVHVHGLVKSGTMGQPIARLPEGYRPPHQLLFSANSADAPASLGVYADGNIVPRTGSNTWVSINVLFAPGR